VIADNKLALNSGWDRALLLSELQALADLDFDVEIAGFSLPEFEVSDGARKPGRGRDNAEPPSLAAPAPAVTRCDDVWLLDRHQALYADAGSAAWRSSLRRRRGRRGRGLARRQTGELGRRDVCLRPGRRR
jgi:hypothetical protein